MGKTWKMPPLPPKAQFLAPKIDFVTSGAGAEVMRLVGAEALAANILMLPMIIRNAANREMSIIAHEIILDAQENYVPVDVGNLRDSGDSDEAVENSTQEITQIGMWFGGEPTVEQTAHGVVDVRKYALEQHENMEYKHNDPARPQAGAKYLERPFVTKMPDIGPRIARAIAEALGMNSAFVSMALLSTDEPITMVDPDTGGPA